MLATFVLKIKWHPFIRTTQKPCAWRIRCMLVWLLTIAQQSAHTHTHTTTQVNSLWQICHFDITISAFFTQILRWRGFLVGIKNYNCMCLCCMYIYKYVCVRYETKFSSMLSAYTQFSFNGAQTYIHIRVSQRS